MIKVPRKKKKQIPEGVYCYTMTSGFKELGGGEYGYTIKSCPFYKHVEGIEGHCKLLNCETEDQLKDCGIKDKIKFNETI